MNEFRPSEIYLDPAVKNHAVTKRVLKNYPHLPVYEVSDRRLIKFPTAISKAKKQLYITAFKGNAIKSCQGMGNEYVCCNYYTISLVTDCHLECTYCILQDYLKNNPVITIYANIEDIITEMREKVEKHPDKTFRFGSGELSDSLALDHITEFSKDLIAFANEHKNVLIEFKTKTSNIQNFLDTPHKGNVIISWSLNPQKYIEKEELKCDSLSQRIEAAKQCSAKGFPIGFHLDPLLYFDDWKNQYTDLIEMVADHFKNSKIAWISVGSLRFTPELKNISMARFPKSKIMTAELFPNKDGKVRYFRPIREEMYKYITDLLKQKIPHAPFYLCMETKNVWDKVFGNIPKNNQVLETHLTQNFAC